MFTDSHCQLSFPELQAQMLQIREAMQEAQVDRARCICTRLEEFETVHALATTARTVEHPYNPGLMLEFLVSRAALALSVK